MAATPDNNLRLDVPDVGADDNTWGTLLNALIGEFERALTDNVSLAFVSSDITLTATGAAGEQARKMVLDCSGTLAGAVNIIAPNEPKVYIVKNGTTEAFALGIKTATGSALDIPQGETLLVWCDGANVFETINANVSGTPALATNALQLGGVVAANYAQNAAKNTWSKPQIVQATQATLVTGPTPDTFAVDADLHTTVVVPQSEITVDDVEISNPINTPIDGQILIVVIEQHASTPVDVSWGTEFIFPDDTPIGLTQTANKVDAFSFMYMVNLDRWLNFGTALNLPRS